MFKIKNLTVRNFMSIGNATQAVDFDRADLTLVLGKNIDLGGDDTGARNGTGKTTIVNALSYALYGQALTNIKKDNLINKTNSKGMLVTIEFEHNGTAYRIERGRKPNIMKFYVEGAEQEITDEAQGDSRETQAAITRMIGMSHDMFKHIVALNTYTEPFLNLRTNDQKAIIEQLLGITLLSEKAENLKTQLKDTKDAVKEEEYRIKAEQDANAAMQEQVNSLKRRQQLWNKKHTENLESLDQAIAELEKIDIELELAAHKKLADYVQIEKDIAVLTAELTRTSKEKSNYEKSIAKLKTELTQLDNHTCYACGQTFHDSGHEQVLLSKKTQFADAEQQLITITETEKQLTAAISQLVLPDVKPSTFYDAEADAYEHKSSITSLHSQRVAKAAEQDPYVDQIADMEKVTSKEVDFSALNNLVNLREHQDFLLKLLTNKDSFIRKRIIDQNLSYLNSRLSFYLDQIGLPHTVLFQSDLTVEITELGRDLDFDNLSRGERNRLILSLSWAFRDVYESLFDPINLLFIDELIDSGMDTSGVEHALGILKKMSRESNKSIWLVSHKDELAGRVNNILTVTKESGFTTYSTDVDVI